MAFGESLLQSGLSIRDFALVISTMQHSSMLQKKGSFKLYLRSLFPTINNNQLVSLLLIFLLENYLQFGELEKAETLIQQILNNQQNSEAEVFALLKMLQIQLHIDDDLGIPQKITEDVLKALKNKGKINKRV